MLKGDKMRVTHYRDEAYCKANFKFTKCGEKIGVNTISSFQYQIVMEGPD